MRVLGWLIGIPAALLVVAFAVANRQPLTLELWPLPWSLAVPTYLAVLGALALGLVLGAGLAGLSALKMGRRARRERRRADALARQLDAGQAAAQPPAAPPAAGTPLPPPGA